MKKELSDSCLNLQYQLDQFTGTMNYYNHSFGNLNVLLTDGCHFVREQYKASWLFDLIVLFQVYSNIKSKQFQIWKLQHLEKKCLITCDDGNGNLLVKQSIDFSTFPLDKIVIWVENGVALLPTEH